MIDSGDIFAEIDDLHGMVLFREDPEEYNDLQMMERLHSQMQTSMHLAAKLQRTHETVIRTLNVQCLA